MDRGGKSFTFEKLKTQIYGTFSLQKHKIKKYIYICNMWKISGLFALIMGKKSI